MGEKRKHKDEIKKFKDKYDIVIGVAKNKENDLDLENQNKEIEVENEILSIYNYFYSNLNKVDDFFKLNDSLLKKEEKNKKKKSNDFLKKYQIKEEKNEIILGLSKKEFEEFYKNNREEKIIGLGEIILPKSMLIYFHSLFENFLSKILVLIYNNSPEQFNDNNIKFTFSELKDFDSIDDAKQYIINQKISNILYSSIDKQYQILFNLLGVTEEDSNNFPIKNLIEISLRRNLFTHEDGIVNDIYINKCNKYGIKNNFKKGTKIIFEDKYFDNVYKTYYEFLIKITFFTRVRLSGTKKKYEDAVGGFINNRAFYLIQENELDLGLRLLDFVLKPKIIKKIDEAVYLMILINKALIFKMKKNVSEVEKILKEVDWSAKSDLYKFSNYILNENWEESGKLMLKVVKKNKNTDEEYLSDIELKTWPLFFEFKEQDIFRKNYKKIFKKDFILDF